MLAYLIVRVRPNHSSSSNHNRLLFVSLVTEINATIYVLHNQDRPIRRRDQQLSELRIALQISELKIIYAKVQVVGHGSNQTRLAGSWWTIQQVPTFPCLPNLPIVVLPPHKPVKIRHYLPLELWVHRQSVECGGVVEVDGDPWILTATVHAIPYGVELHSLLGLFHGLV